MFQGHQTCHTNPTLHPHASPLLYREPSKIHLIPLLPSQTLLTQRKTLEMFCVLKIIMATMQTVQYLRREIVDRLLDCLHVAYKLLLVVASPSNIFVCFGSFSLLNVVRRFGASCQCAQYMANIISCTIEWKSTSHLVACIYAKLIM